MLITILLRRVFWNHYQFDGLSKVSDKTKTMLPKGSSSILEISEHVSLGCSCSFPEISDHLIKYMNAKNDKILLL